MQKELYSKLDKYWQQLVDDLIQSLKDVDRYASGVTAQSIGEFNTKPVSIQAGGFTVLLNMPDYYEFLDEGVSGAIKNTKRSQFTYRDRGKGPKGGQLGLPPSDAIKKFMRNRSLTPKDVRKAKNSTTKAAKRKSADDLRNSYAYAIAYNIWKNGTKKTNFYSDVVNDQRLLDFETNALEFYGDYIIKILATNK
jgi:hypothetical protein